MYSEKQIREAKKGYNAFMRYTTARDEAVYDVNPHEAERRADYHNKVVDRINAGDKELEKEWKYFFLNEEIKKDRKEAESKAKKDANKQASAGILEPVKELRKLGEFGKWLNTSGNPYRKQHFNKKYTTEAVNEFLLTL